MRKILISTLIIFIIACSAEDKFDENIVLLKAKSCKEEGKTDKAKALAMSYLQKYPDDPDMKLFLANIYYQDKNYKEAESLLEPAAKQYPNYSDLTKLLMKVRDAEMAKIPDALKTPGFAPEDTNNQNDAVDEEKILNKVKALKIGGDTDEAKSMAWKYLRQDPFSPRMIFLLISLYLYEINHSVRQAKYKCE